MTQVLVVGSPGDSPELQAQLSSLSDRCAVVIGPCVTSTVLALADALDAIGPGESVALVGGALVAADEVLLRLIDDPQLRLGALVQNRARTLATQGSVILSAATSHHLVVDPDATFLDGIYVASQYVARVAHVLREHASEFPSDDALSAALSVLSRDEQLPAMTAVRSEPFPATALGSEAAQVRAELAVLDPLLGARYSARPGDGFYSTFVLRRISAHITPWAVRRKIAPNAVTVFSAIIGLCAAGAFAIGTVASLLIGAVLLQVSLVLDCVDGEIARATRTRSAFGAWLDGATDRLKEYAALAGLAAAGHHLWLLAASAMAVQTIRHLRGFAFDEAVIVAWRAGFRDTRPMTDTSPWTRPAGAGRGPDPLTGSPSMWLRRLIRMPIAERWLVLSLAAAADRPALGLVAYLALTALAEVWSLLSSLQRSRDPALAYPAALRHQLAAYRDDGLLAPVISRWAPGRTLGWLMPPATMLVEAGVVLGAAAGTRHWAAAAFGFVAIVAWHRYDIVYRRGGGAPQVPSIVSLLGLGWLVRSALVGVAAATGHLPGVLLAGICWLGVLYVPESLLVGLRTLVSDRARRLASTPSGLTPERA